MKYKIIFESDNKLNPFFLNLIKENIEFCLYSDYDIILKPIKIKKGK